MKACPVKVCEEPIARDRVMCRAHWFMVPEGIRTEVWRAYHQWENRKEDRNRLNRLRVLQQKAIAHVDALIAHPPEPQTGN